jgi:hypothetical protein
MRELDVRHMLAFARMLDNLREVAGDSVSNDSVRDFLRERCTKAIGLAMPPSIDVEEDANDD